MKRITGIGELLVHPHHNDRRGGCCGKYRATYGQNDSKRGTVHFGLLRAAVAMGVVASGVVAVLPMRHRLGPDGITADFGVR